LGTDLKERELEFDDVRDGGIEQRAGFGQGALRLSVRGTQNEHCRSNDADEGNRESHKAAPRK
jgi:hypothetical protein